MAAARKASMCPRCGNLVGSEDNECVTCGLRMGTPVHGAAFFLSILKRYGSATSILTGMFGIFFLGMVVLQGGLFASGENGLIRKLLFGFSSEVLIRCGAEHYSLVFGRGEVWRLVTSMFIHGGIVHIGFNVYVFLQLGRLCELYFDARRTFIIFLLSGLFGSVASCMAGFFSVGASGGILGVAGAILVRARLSGGGIDRVIYSQLMTWVIMIIFIGFLVPIIDWVGHLGGLIAGGIVGYFLIREGGIRTRMHSLVFGFCLLVAAICLIMGLMHCLNGPPP